MNVIGAITWWTSRIFFIFFLLGEGEGGVQGAGREGGRFFFLENPRREGKGPRGREGVCGKLGNWEGGAKFFFFGAEMPTKTSVPFAVNGEWETALYTPQVLGGAALFGNLAPVVYKIQGP